MGGEQQPYKGRSLSLLGGIPLEVYGGATQRTKITKLYPILLSDTCVAKVWSRATQRPTPTPAAAEKADTRVFHHTRVLGRSLLC